MHVAWRCWDKPNQDVSGRRVYGGLICSVAVPCRAAVARLAQRVGQLDSMHTWAQLVFKTAERWKEFSEKDQAGITAWLRRGTGRSTT